MVPLQRANLMETDWPEVSGPASLSTDEAHVWAVPLQRRGREDEMLAALSLEERGRAERFRVDVPRRQFTVARAALRTLLSRYLNIPATEIILTEDTNGKPRLAQQQWFHATAFQCGSLRRAGARGDARPDVRLVSMWSGSA